MINGLRKKILKRMAGMGREERIIKRVRGSGGLRGGNKNGVYVGGINRYMGE